MLCCLHECYRKVVKLRDMENSENERSLKNVMLTEWNKMYPEDQLSRMLCLLGCVNIIKRRDRSIKWMQM